MEILMTYYNPKTKSKINFIANNIKDIETFDYLSKMMIWNDNSIIKKNLTDLVKVLNNVKKPE